ncbi:LURP-one-related/scramblase family protein [Saccharothrix stipae]
MLTQATNVLHMHQKVTLMVNRYEVFADNGGEPGPLVAFVEQKRMAFKEQVTIYTDAGKNQVLAGFRARKVIDLGSGYDVTEGNGQPIGRFRKDFGKSLTNSTWHLDQPGAPTATGSERNAGIAILRRVWGFLPFVNNVPFPFRYHFDFVRDGVPVFSVDKKTWVRDHYLIQIADPYVDRRVVIAQAVAVDALQSR